MMGLKLYTDILENNIRVMAAILICLLICGLMRIKSAKLKLLLMSLVWVRILIPLSIRFNIKRVSTDRHIVRSELHRQCDGNNNKYV